jgi:integrase
MRAIMGLIKNSHGVYHVRKKVPKRLEEATARILGKPKSRQTWLKRSLGAKDLATANKLAKPVLIEFDRTLERAEELLKEQPRRATLSRVEITRMAEYHYATLLANDEAARREGRQTIVKFGLSPPDAPAYGLTDEELERIGRTYSEELPAVQRALARGDIEHVMAEVLELLDIFQIRLEPTAPAFRMLGMEVLRQDVMALQAIQRRHAGEPIETPRQLEPAGTPAPTESGRLSAAFAGWQRQRERPANTIAEAERAVRLFTELHGDMPVAAIRKSHVHRFREALQEVPRYRSGKLTNMKLPELAEWARGHPRATKITAATVNKQLGAVQAVCIWAHDKGGMIPDEISWADPFARQRLTADEPTREPFTHEELNTVFGGPVFTEGARPIGGKGEAAYWLPLLALFTGARRAELAALTVENVDIETFGTAVLTITEDRKRRKRLKTRASQRAVPIHAELVRLGFLEFVAGVRKAHGRDAWLFPEIAPDRPGGTKAWTKWFSRYIRDRGVTSSDKVFHSFRHGFKDALRAGGVDEDLNDALTGHLKRTVGRGYGFKDMVRAFGIERLTDGVARARFTGADLSRIRTTPGATPDCTSGRSQRRSRTT